jgi:hypothetical protein
MPQRSKHNQVGYVMNHGRACASAPSITVTAGGKLNSPDDTIVF